MRIPGRNNTAHEPFSSLASVSLIELSSCRATNEPLIFARIASALSLFPLAANQRGLSGTKNMARKKKMAGIAEAPNIDRHTSTTKTLCNTPPSENNPGLTLSFINQALAK